MGKADEYRLWAVNAITEPCKSNNLYYYDKSKDRLFCLLNQDNSLHPGIYKSPEKEKATRLKTLKDYIVKIQSQTEDIVLLPKLSLEEKRHFLTRFARSVPDVELRDKLISESESLTEEDAFDYKTDLKHVDKLLWFNFDISKGKFTASKAIEAFKPLGISEESSIVW